MAEGLSEDALKAIVDGVVEKLQTVAKEASAPTGGGPRGAAGPSEAAEGDGKSITEQAPPPPSLRV